MSEFLEHKAVCNYIRFKYPKVVFFSDLSGIKMPIGLAVKIKSLKSSRGIPDLFIAEPRGEYSGLFIELKKTGEKLFKAKSNLPSSEHIAEQLLMIDKLKTLGYYADFAIGYEQAVKMIDNYFNLKR